ncbi:hypothetical protein [Archaeoglobus sp.]
MKLKPLFKNVMIFSLILSLTFPFSFNYLLESSKPEAPKEKFDAEALFAVGKFILMMAAYMFAPWVFALILAYTYGYNWRILRSVEGKRYIGLIYIAFFIILFSGMMAVATVRNLHRYQVGERLLELLLAEVPYLLSLFFSLHSFYAKMATGGRICRSYLSIQRPLIGRNLPRTKKRDWHIMW